MDAPSRVIRIEARPQASALDAASAQTSDALTVTSTGG